MSSATKMLAILVPVAILVLAGLAVLVFAPAAAFTAGLHVVVALRHAVLRDVEVCSDLQGIHLLVLEVCSDLIKLSKVCDDLRAIESTCCGSNASTGLGWHRQSRLVQTEYEDGLDLQEISLKFESRYGCAASVWVRQVR